MYLFNCEKKDTYIDRISNFEDYPQQELLRIVERYMYIDENDRISLVRGLSNRNTLNAGNSDNQGYITESEFMSKYMSKLEKLNKEKDNLEREKIELLQKINDLENELDNFVCDRDEDSGRIKKLEDSLQKKSFENDELKRQNTDLNKQIKQLSELTKDTRLVNELKAKLEDMTNEVNKHKEEIKSLEQSHGNEINKLNEQIDLLHENVSALTDMKTKYEKMKEIYKDYDVLKDRLNYFESANQDYTKLKMNYMNLSDEKMSLEKLAKELEQKLLERNLKTSTTSSSSARRYERTPSAEPKVSTEDVLKFEKEISKFKNELLKKDDVISELNEKVAELELKVETLQNRPKEKETIVINETKTIREVHQNNMNSTQDKDNDRITQLQNEMQMLKLEHETEMNKKNEEVEFYKKDNDETKDRYEKEFELMASCVYNLGLNYWSMKMEYTQKLNERPSWLIKERQRYFNGDF
jgi:chromosome segregation ATPase